VRYKNRSSVSWKSSIGHILANLAICALFFIPQTGVYARTYVKAPVVFHKAKLAKCAIDNAWNYIAILGLDAKWDVTKQEFYNTAFIAAVSSWGTPVLYRTYGVKQRQYLFKMKLFRVYFGQFDATIMTDKPSKHFEAVVGAGFAPSSAPDKVVYVVGYVRKDEVWLAPNFELCGSG